MERKDTNRVSHGIEIIVPEYQSLYLYRWHACQNVLIIFVEKFFSCNKGGILNEITVGVAAWT